MDITMCVNSKCPDAESCLRKQGKPSDYQSYGYYTRDEKGCEGFIEFPEQEKKLKQETTQISSVPKPE